MIVVPTALAALAAFAAPAIAAHRSPPPPAAAPAWIGTWTLDVQGSDFGMMPAPDSGLTVFTEVGDRLVMSRTVWTSQRGHQTVDFDQATDGEASAGSSSRGTELPSRVWWEGEVLVVEVEVEANVGEVIVTDRMTLDGDTITMERTLEVPSMDDEIAQTIVYRRR